MNRRDALWLLGVTTAGTLSSSLLSGCSVNPVTGEKQLMLMSEGQEIAIDRAQSPHQFSADYGEFGDTGVNRYLSDVGKTLAASTHRPKMPYTFRGVNATHVNAYAFPGGSIAATRGILLGMKSEAELAGLLGHELGHVNARHAAQRQTRTLLTQVAMAGASRYAQGLGGTASMLVNNLGGIASGALLAHYSRDDERQADDLGMQYMARVGENPQGMVDLMQLLNTQNKHKPSALQQMFSTHPMSRERIQTAKRTAQGRFAALLEAPNHRERYMDNMAPIRRQKRTILALQDADEALRKKNTAQAEKLLRKALKHTPDDYAALMKMSKLQLERGKKGAALRYAEEAQAVNPHEAQAFQVAGIVQMMQRHYSKAQSNLARYDKLLPGNPGTRFLQGVAFENMGRKGEAARYYMNYLRAGAQGEQATYARKRLLAWKVIKAPKSK
uniref:Peptidase M48 domain-containing protein n=1 Tax=Magnetococcus massalia (strain MO-1) TaxID=451514 RepID=A0A1S7LFU7_MAGMO|nr:Putative protein containing peptidase M48, Ste24p domain. Putative putative Zn-dependent protease [Candidatus Magnetococcus massalia]